MPFEKFVESGRSYRPKVSIRKHGSIGFNAGAVKKWVLNDYKYALLFYDKDSKKIGIRPVKEEEDGTHRINHNRMAVWISARRFVDYFEIPVNETKRYDATWDDKEKMIVIEVS